MGTCDWTSRVQAGFKEFTILLIVAHTASTDHEIFAVAFRTTPTTAAMPLNDIGKPFISDYMAKANSGYT